MMEENEETLSESDEKSDFEGDEAVDEISPEGDSKETKSPKEKTLNLQEFMNLMTIMVREVRKKKIWLVRRIIKKIKLLKEKKGTEAQKKKNEDHLTALQQEIFYSRILDISKTAKFLLLNDQKDLNRLLSYSYNDTKPTVRFQAKLGLLIDSIKKKVETFHKAYPNWREFLPVMFFQNRRKRKSRLEKMGIFLNRSLTKNKQTRERSTLTPEGEQSNHSNSIVDSFNSWNVSGDLIEKPIKEEKIELSNDEIENKKSKDANKSSKKPNLVTEAKSASKTEDSAPIKKRKISDSDDSIPTLIPIDSKPPKIAKNDPEIVSPPPVKSDPFFMTADNQEYLSTSKSKVPDFNPTKNDFEKPPQKKFEKRSNFEKRPSFNKKSNFDPEKFNPKFTKPTTFNEKNNPKPQFNKKFNKSPGNAKKVENEKPILHPSWQAKKKQTGITEFKGTKIQFD